VITTGASLSVPSATILIFPKTPVVYMGEIPPGVDRPGLQSATTAFGLQSATKRLTLSQASPSYLIRRAA
jgi:hypothetical protein